MTMEFVIKFTDLNINVTVRPPDEAAIVAQIESLQRRLDESETKLKDALAGSTTSPAA